MTGVIGSLRALSWRQVIIGMTTRGDGRSAGGVIGSRFNTMWSRQLRNAKLTHTGKRLF